MPGQAPFNTGEHDLLLGYLAQQRYVMRIAAFGLTDEQARTPAATPSPLTVGGLVKHVANTEQGWIDIVAQRERPDAGASEDDYVEGFTMRPDESLADLFAFADSVAADTEAVVRADPRPGSSRARSEGCAVVPRRSRRLVGTVGADAPGGRDRPPRGPRRHRPRGGRRRDRVPAHGRGRGLARDPWLQPWEPAR